MTAIASSVPAAAALGPSSLSLLAPAQPDQREQLSAAAKQFEAIFLRQMLATARKADFGGKGLFDSEAIGTFRQMQDERFAEIASQTGALGMAKMIEAQLARMLPGGAGTGAAAETAAAAAKGGTGDGV
jgi:flagellar protein FlgJ